jgi:hypothetical protein
VKFKPSLQYLEVRENPVGPLLMDENNVQILPPDSGPVKPRLSPEEILPSPNHGSGIPLMSQGELLLGEAPPLPMPIAPIVP